MSSSAQQEPSHYTTDTPPPPEWAPAPEVIQEMAREWAPEMAPECIVDRTPTGLKWGLTGLRNEVTAGPNEGFRGGPGGPAAPDVMISQLRDQPPGFHQAPRLSCWRIVCAMNWA